MVSYNIKEFTAKSPGRRLAILSRLSMANLSADLKKLGITRGQIGFILCVLQCDGIFQEELSEMLFIDRAATARTLLDLERKGLVVREPDTEDRRKKCIHATPKCHALEKNLLEVLDRNNQAIFRGLDEEQRQSFLDMLDTLIGNLRDAIKESA